ncbi:Retrovirus-related Pol polyprotein from transposon 17.6-like protein, partial [Leptotrombidium deliense]
PTTENVYTGYQRYRELTKLLRKNTELEWSDEQEQAFNRLKGVISTAPVLARFDPSLPKTLRVDASGYGIGGTFVQNGRPVFFGSRMLSEAEMKLTQSEKQLLAAIYLIGKCKQWLAGYHFTIETDHCALCWIKAKKNLPLKLMRWSLFLQSFDYDIIYKSCKQLCDADCLSRYPVDAPEISDDLDDTFEFNINEELARSISDRQKSDLYSGKVIESLINEGNQILAYNTAVHESTNFSPYYLVHGREAVLPPDVTLDLPGQTASEDIEEYVHQVTQN